jgi:hypothetical protein
VFDETFFQTSLPAHIKAKGTESGAEPSVHVTLRNGQAYRLGRILEVSPQWVMCEVYPLDGKSPRQHSTQAQPAGASQHDLALQTFYVKPSICRTTRRCYIPYKLSAQTTACRLSCSMCRASSYGSPDDHTAYTILAHFCPRPRKIVACA